MGKHHPIQGKAPSPVTTYVLFRVCICVLLIANRQRLNPEGQRSSPQEGPGGAMLLLLQIFVVLNPVAVGIVVYRMTSRTKKNCKQIVTRDLHTT